MAVSKRKNSTTAKKKPSATKKRKTKSASKVLVVKVGGVTKRFTQESCHSTKTAATAQANRIRAQGNNARVIPGESGRMCVFKGGKTSSKAPRALQRTRKRA